MIIVRISRGANLLFRPEILRDVHMVSSEREDFPLSYSETASIKRTIGDALVGADVFVGKNFQTAEPVNQDDV